MSKKPNFTKSRIILTEGYSDVAFLQALLVDRNSPEFDVFSVEEVGGKPGNLGFEDAVLISEVNSGFHKVKDFVIIADNDDNPDKSFTSIIAQIEKARKKPGNSLKSNWGKATEPNKKADGSPSVSIWMWPSAGEPGCLETLFWKVIKSKHPLEAVCAENAIACSKADKWSNNKRDKALVHCFNSIRNKNNPASSLKGLFYGKKALIPLGRSEFTPIARFLAKI